MDRDASRPCHPEPISVEVRERRRAAAATYLPARVRWLLIAEAPPMSEDRYYYFEDVRKHDALFRNVAQAVLREPPHRSQKKSGLLSLNAASS